MDLVVGASNDAVKSLVSKLGSLLAQEYTLIRGVSDDIQYINDELASMHAFLNRLKQEAKHDEQRQGLDEAGPGGGLRHRRLRG